LAVLLSRLRVLNQRDANQALGLYLCLGPVGLLAWLQNNVTLALVLLFILMGAGLLLRGRGAVHNRGRDDEAAV
jgi:hypothetical protein